MRNKSAHTSLNGLYWARDDYYCVWAKDRDPLLVEKTECHEYCHYLIDNGQRMHFCVPGVD